MLSCPVQALHFVLIPDDLVVCTASEGPPKTCSTPEYSAKRSTILRVGGAHVGGGLVSSVNVHSRKQLQESVQMHSMPKMEHNGLVVARSTNHIVRHINGNIF